MCYIEKIQYKCPVMEDVISDFTNNKKKKILLKTLNSILLLKKARNLFTSLQGPRRDLRSKLTFFLFLYKMV